MRNLLTGLLPSNELIGEALPSMDFQSRYDQPNASGTFGIAERNAAMVTRVINPKFALRFADTV